MVERVIVWGRTAIIDGQLSLIPSVPEGVEHFRTDCAVAITGDRLPPLDARVSVEGDLLGQELRVAQWSPSTRIPTSWEETGQAAGVDRDVAYATLAAVPRDWELISRGAAKTRSGRMVAVLYIVRAGPRVSEWTHRQAEGSVYVYSFIRDAGEPAVLVGGQPGS